MARRLLTCVLLATVAAATVASNLAPEVFSSEVFNSEVHLPTQAAKMNARDYARLGNVRVLDTLFNAPASIKNVQVRFRIYNRQTAVEGIEFDPTAPLSFDLGLLARSGFDPTRAKTVVMVPGYRSGNQSKWLRSSRENWLELDDVNVIEVDWSKNNLNRGFYPEAVALTPLIARQITMLLHYLAQLNGLEVTDRKFTSKLHFVGHSLGAHICAFVGKDLGEQRVGRITGLDPAGPSFDSFDNTQRLHKSDAMFVEALHTNGGQIKYSHLVAAMPLWALANLPAGRSVADWLGRSYTGEGDTAWFGISLKLAHVDYYANSGRIQPGCAGLLHVCDHNRATQIYSQILAYETRLRRELAHIVGEKRRAKMIEQSRLLAFNSLDYDRFLDGASLAKCCPKVMSLDRHLSASDVGPALDSCALPIDLIAPADSVLGEFEAKLQNSTPPSTLQLFEPPPQSYFFKTLAGDNLVGQHFLLKLYLARPETHKWHPNKCSLSVQMKMVRRNTESGADEVVELELDLGQLQGANKNSLTIGGERPIATPFVHPNGAGASAALVELLWQNSDSIEEAMGDEFVQTGSATERLIDQLMPREVVLTVAAPKAASLMGTVASATKGALLWLNPFRSAQVDCKLSLKLVEVHPINGHRNNLAGLYATWRGGRRVPVQMASELRAKLEGRPEVELTKFASEAQTSVSLALDSVVFG